MVKRKAFSLVEMLVAVLLITLMIGVAIFAFRYQLMAIHKTKKIGINKVITYSQLKSSLESMKYYVVDEYSMLNKPMKNLHYYFNGTKKEINYITQNPIFSDNVALARLRCEDSKLLYKEEKLYGTMDFLRPELPESSREMVFYSNLERCEFSYHKVDAIKETLQNNLPTAIMINLSSNDVASEFYVSMKNDYNRSIYYVNDAIYPDE